MLKKLNSLIQEATKIDVKHPGVLEIPKNKKFWEMPITHYEGLVERKGYQRIIKALTNIETWNKDKHKDISKKASDIADKLKKIFRPESK